MHQSGLLDYAARKSTQKVKRNPCSIIGSKSKESGDPEMLKLSDFSGAFIILGVGFGFAFIVLFLELFLNLSSKILFSIYY